MTVRQSGICFGKRLRSYSAFTYLAEICFLLFSKNYTSQKNLLVTESVFFFFKKNIINM